CGIPLADDRAGRAEMAALVVRNDDDQPQPGRALGGAEERYDAPAVRDGATNAVAQHLDGQLRHILEANAAPVAESDEAGRLTGHGARPPSIVAALASASASGRGR